jgi:hypothetical protein
MLYNKSHLSMSKNFSFGITAIIIFFALIAFYSTISILRELSSLSTIHSIFRIVDILLRSVGLISSVTAIVGLWRMKIYGYYAGVVSCCFEILLRLLIFVPGLKFPSQTYPAVDSLAKFANVLGIIIFVFVIYYLNKNRTRFIK